MKRIGVMANVGKPAAPGVLARLAKGTDAMDAALMTCDELGAWLPGAERVTPEAMAEQCEVLIAFGGDGTMLRAVRLLDGADVPVMGVNLGGLGFMTSVPESDLERGLEALRTGDYGLSSRTLIRCRLMRKGAAHAGYRALNDIAVGWGESSRVVTLTVLIGDEEITSYVCDGLILSTPTGSTGHSLSTGGPILHPGTPAFVLCPICPHTLGNRPLVVPDRSMITVLVQEAPKRLLLAVDGQGHEEVLEGDRLEMCKDSKVARFINLPGYSYFSVLSQKLHWRGSSLSR